MSKSFADRVVSQIEEDIPRYEYSCSFCGYEGSYACAIPATEGWSAPWCPKCGLNNTITQIKVEDEREEHSRGSNS